MLFAATLVLLSYFAKLVNKYLHFVNNSLEKISWQRSVRILDDKSFYFRLFVWIKPAPVD